MAEKQEDWGLAPPDTKRRIASGWDKALIGIFFAIGSIGIWAIKEFQLTPTQHVSANALATSWAVLTMLAYAIIVWRKRKFRLREDMSGDNIYYLGFLFTLVSLAISLANFRGEGSRVQDIIAAFGIGVASTIVGLLLRIIFNQMREDPVEVEQEVRLDLAGAAASVKQTLYDVAASMSTLRISIQQTIEETVRSASDEIKASSTKAAEGFEAEVSVLREAVSELKTEVKGFSRSAANAVKSLDSYFTNLVANTEASTRMRTQVEAVANVAGNVEKMLQAQAKQAEVSTAVHKDVTDVVTRTTPALRGIADLTSSMTTTLGQTQKAMDEFVGAMSSLTQTARRHAEELGTELEKARGYTSQVHLGLVEVTADLVARTEASAASVSVPPHTGDESPEVQPSADDQDPVPEKAA